ncbi:uncharacterized protein DC041_0005907 [Schistosoma bovis]|uniref:Uncharacterized protein n=1 Tax=Schistosoma bovis TaxID=6184 RepID=A0A430QGQ1_SCHBO|nr:uncharacterized protein DC041_0005907 [Schistosoma bovis]
MNTTSRDFNEIHFYDFLVLSSFISYRFIRGMAYVNTVVLITDKYIHFIRTDFINRNNRPAYIRIPLLSIERLELGLEPAIFRPKNFVLRIFYKVPDENSIQKSTSMDMNSQQTPFQPSDLNSSLLLKEIDSSNIAVKVSYRNLAKTFEINNLLTTNTKDLPSSKDVEEKQIPQLNPIIIQIRYEYDSRVIYFDLGDRVSLLVLTEALWLKVHYTYMSWANVALGSSGIPI